MSSAVLPVPFSCEVYSDARGAVVRVAGELDLEYARVLEGKLGQLFDCGATSVVVDLRDLTFMDSTGLRVLLWAHRTAGRRETALSLVAGPPPVQRVFEVTGTEAMLAFVRPGTAG